MQSADARNFNWLLNEFSRNTAGVTDAIAVSADGILLAASAEIPRPAAAQFAAITSGLQCLTVGASRCFDMDGVEQIIVELGRGYLFVTTISQGSSLGVIAEKNCEIGLVAYEMTLFVERAGSVLTPGLISELKNLITV